MAKFKDTKRWKTREEYDKMKGEPRRIAFNVMNVPCPVCGAKAKRPCVGPAGDRRYAAHDERTRLAVRKHESWRARNKRIAAAQKRRWATVEVRYECPICGGDHSRSDHGRATAPTEARP